MTETSVTSREQLKVENLDAILNRLINGTLIAMAILILPAVSASLLRALEFGWKPVMILHIVIVLVLWAAVLLRRKCAYGTRVLVLLSVLVAAAIGAFANIGPASGGTSLFLLAAIYATILLGTRLGVVTAVVCCVTCAFIGFLVYWGHITYTIDFNRYAISPVYWISEVILMVLLTGISVTCLGLMRHSMIGMINTLSERSSELEETNACLQAEITDRQHVAEALHQSRSMLSHILNSVPQSIFWKDGEGVYVGCNKVFAEAVGLNGPEEIIGQTDFDLPWPKAEAEAYRADDQEVFLTNQPKCHIVEPLQQADGTRLWVDTTKVPLTDEEGCVYGILGVYEDVTQRKTADELMRRERDFSRTVIQRSPAFFVAITPEGRLRMMNTAMLSALGYEEEEVIGQDYVSMLVPDRDRDKLTRVFEEILAGKRTLSENHVIAKNRQELLVEWHGTPVFNQAQGLEYFIGMGMDISERKRAENALRESEKRYRNFIANSSEGIYRVDFTHPVPIDMPTKALAAEIAQYAIIGEVNEALAAMYGLKPADMHGRPAIEFAPDYGERAVLVLDHKSYQVTTKETQDSDKDGKVLQLMESYSGEIENGCLSRIWGVQRDITDRKNAERENTRLRNYLKNIVDSMPSMLVGVDAAGKITEWNVEAERATGVQADQAVGQTFAGILPQWASEMARVSRAIQERQVQRHQKVTHWRDSQRGYSDITIYPLVSNGIEGAVVRIDDMTERVRMEEMMIQSEKMMTVGGLAAGMAHEINNPLAGILQNIQVIQNRIKPDLAKNREAAEKCGTTMDVLLEYMQMRKLPDMMNAVMASGKRAAEIVENMLNFSRKSEASFMEHHLSDLIDRTVDLASNDYDLRKKYDFRQIKIVRDYKSEVLPVPCEANKIQQVILNILKNGAQAMAESPNRSEAPQFILRVLGDEKMACIEIEDNGPGMDKDTCKRVFEPFFTTKKVGVGTGLGLSVSYFIISKDHGGTLAVESTVGVGTKFIICLPRAERV